MWVSENVQEPGERECVIQMRLSNETMVLEEEVTKTH